MRIKEGFELIKRDGQNIVVAKKVQERRPIIISYFPKPLLFYGIC